MFFFSLFFYSARQEHKTDLFLHVLIIRQSTENWEFKWKKCWHYIDAQQAEIHQKKKNLPYVAFFFYMLQKNAKNNETFFFSFPSVKEWEALHNIHNMYSILKQSFSTSFIRFGETARYIVMREMSIRKENKDVELLRSTVAVWHSFDV